MYLFARNNDFLNLINYAETRSTEFSRSQVYLPNPQSLDPYSIECATYRTKK